MNQIATYIQDNWKDKEALKGLLGSPLEKEMEFCFGTVPTEKAVVEIVDGKIARIRIWSGATWSAKYGRGCPRVDISL